MDALEQVISAIQELEQDSSTPKQVRERLTATLQVVGEDGERSMKVSRIMNELESLAEDKKVQSDVRMQIFNIVSLLESA